MNRKNWSIAVTNPEIKLSKEILRFIIRQTVVWRTESEFHSVEEISIHNCKRTSSNLYLSPEFDGMSSICLEVIEV